MNDEFNNFSFPITSLDYGKSKNKVHKIYKTNGGWRD